MIHFFFFLLSLTPHNPHDLSLSFIISNIFQKSVLQEDLKKYEITDMSDEVLDHILHPLPLSFSHNPFSPIQNFIKSNNNTSQTSLLNSSHKQNSERSLLFYSRYFCKRVTPLRYNLISSSVDIISTSKLSSAYNLFFSSLHSLSLFSPTIFLSSTNFRKYYMYKVLWFFYLFIVIFILINIIS
jgi:hypothetical protein